MHTIAKVIVLVNYKLELTFDDGACGIVDMSPHVGQGVFAAWKDPAVFESVRIGSSGELVWGEDVDFCADALYLEVTGKRPEDIFPALKREDANA